MCLTSLCCSRYHCYTVITSIFKSSNMCIMKYKNQTHAFICSSRYNNGKQNKIDKKHQIQSSEHKGYVLTFGLWKSTYRVINHNSFL